MSDAGDAGDCCCGDGSTPTPTRDGGGTSLPENAGASTQQIQIVGQRSTFPDGTPDTRGIEVTPQGEMKIAMRSVTTGFTGNLVVSGTTWVFHNGLLVSTVAGSGS